MFNSKLSLETLNNTVEKLCNKVSNLCSEFSKECGLAAEGRKLAAEERKLAVEERKLAAEDRKLEAEFRSYVLAELKVNAEFRSYVMAELKVNAEFREKASVALDFLVAELSRFKGDSDQMLLSIYAFCTLYQLPFSYGDLATMGRKATWESRKTNAEVQTTADPRFGTVNLYEPEVLERLFLTED
jgi:hypothetical protein